MTKKQKKTCLRIIISLILFIIVSLVPGVDSYRRYLYLIPYLIAGYDILYDAVRGVINLKPFDENFLMAVATIGAFLLGEYSESVAVMLFYQTGELFQSIAVGKSRRNISSLMDIRPDFANLCISDCETQTVDPESVEVGSTILVRPGEKVPLDGIITDGETSLDTSALTGEALPKKAFVGEEIPSGVINLSHVIKVKTTKRFENSTVSKILELVENASSRKSKSENFITKFARVYTPAVCFGALALALLPPIFSIMAGKTALWSVWIYRALTFLVISCPCALVISIPLSFFAGIGGASGEGILIKGSNYLETLANTKYVVFDKTGTLTKGIFEVTDTFPFETDKDELLKIASLAESYSTHPIAKSIIRAYGKKCNVSEIESYEEVSGMGIEAVIGGKRVLVGNEKLMLKKSIKYQVCNCDGTVIYVANDGKFYGSIVINDSIKESAKSGIDALKKLGIKKTVMLTGDNEEIASKVAKRLGISEVHSSLLPQNKVEIVEKMLCEKTENEKLIFVGDGINDAPVLSRADVGVAMGGIGSDAAIEAADAVIMDDNVQKIAKAIKISKKCMNIVYQNIFFAIGVKAICLLLVGVGLANMWAGIFADVGVMVIAIVNAIRALYVKKL